MSLYRDPQLPSIFTQRERDLRQFDRDLVQVLDSWASNIKTILDGGITFQDNVNAVILEVTTNTVKNKEDIFTHTLGKIPILFIVAGRNKKGVVYESGPFTTTTIAIKTTEASVNLKLILM